jgi:hypothetical protein
MQADSQRSQFATSGFGSAASTGIAAPAARGRGWLIAAAALVAVIVLAAVAYFGGWIGKKGPYSQADLKPQVLTSNSSEDPVALTSISPDGKYLLFADLEGLHLRLMTTGETQTLPTPNEFCFR